MSRNAAQSSFGSYGDTMIKQHLSSHCKRINGKNIQKTVDINLKDLAKSMNVFKGKKQRNCGSIGNDSTSIGRVSSLMTPLCGNIKQFGANTQFNRTCMESCNGDLSKF